MCLCASFEYGIMCIAYYSSWFLRIETSFALSLSEERLAQIRRELLSAFMYFQLPCSYHLWFFSVITILVNDALFYIHLWCVGRSNCDYHSFRLCRFFWMITLMKVYIVLCFKEWNLSNVFFFFCITMMSMMFLDIRRLHEAVMSLRISRCIGEKYIVTFFFTWSGEPHRKPNRKPHWKQPRKWSPFICLGLEAQSVSKSSISRKKIELGSWSHINKRRSPKVLLWSSSKTLMNPPLPQHKSEPRSEKL